MSVAGAVGKTCIGAGDSAAAVVMFGRVKRFLAIAMAAACCLGVSAAEKVFEFTAPEGKLPEGWTPVLAGKGKPGNWKVVFDEVPPLLKPLTAQALLEDLRAINRSARAMARHPGSGRQGRHRGRCAGRERLARQPR